MHSIVFIIFKKHVIPGQYGPALALIGAGFIGCNTVAAVILLTLAVGLSGASYSAFQV